MILTEEKKELITKLKKYRDICDEAIEKARLEKIQGAINWGDIKCRNVNFCTNLDGDEHYQFIVDEADPDNYDFQFFLDDYISEIIGYEIKIEVITEW